MCNKRLRHLLRAQNNLFRPVWAAGRTWWIGKHTTYGIHAHVSNWSIIIMWMAIPRILLLLLLHQLLLMLCANWTPKQRLTIVNDTRQREKEREEIKNNTKQTYNHRAGTRNEKKRANKYYVWLSRETRIGIRVAICVFILWLLYYITIDVVYASNAQSSVWAPVTHWTHRSYIPTHTDSHWLTTNYGARVQRATGNGGYSSPIIITVWQCEF